MHSPLGLGRLPFLRVYSVIRSVRPMVSLLFGINHSPTLRDECTRCRISQDVIGLWAERCRVGESYWIGSCADSTTTSLIHTRQWLKKRTRCLPGRMD